jgi:hypothetical protein
MTPTLTRQQTIALPHDLSPEADARRSDRDMASEAQGGRCLVPHRVEQALSVLLESYDYAQDIGCRIWEFAVELAAFRAFELTPSDWRWLCMKGLVDHGREQMTHDEPVRTFLQGGALRLTRRTCFVLTEAGERYARQLVAERGRRSRAIPEPAAMPPQAGPALDLLDLSQMVPVWDRDRQQLKVGKFIVKEFKLPAPNQETVLAAFQEENWPPRIDDPLPPQGDIDPKRRLHDTITSLNRNQKNPLVRFLGDGSGQGVRWEGVPQSNENSRH